MRVPSLGMRVCDSKCLEGENATVTTATSDDSRESDDGELLITQRFMGSSAGL
jgi:hypothetical protein